nr:MAG TPA: hypothetical protein [Caudoviricetes sp.]
MHISSFLVVFHIWSRDCFGSSFFVHISVHLFKKTTKTNKNKNYKNLVKLSLCSFYLFLFLPRYRWQGTFLSL